MSFITHNLSVRGKAHSSPKDVTLTLQLCYVSTSSYCSLLGVETLQSSHGNSAQKISSLKKGVCLYFLAMMIHFSSHTCPVKILIITDLCLASLVLEFNKASHH